MTGGIPRFVVIDYKTNWLGPEGKPLGTRYYRPRPWPTPCNGPTTRSKPSCTWWPCGPLPRWRMPGYDPAVNLGGALYLFVRG